MTFDNRRVQNKICSNFVKLNGYHDIW